MASRFDARCDDTEVSLSHVHHCLLIVLLLGPCPQASANSPESGDTGQNIPRREAPRLVPRSHPLGPTLVSNVPHRIGGLLWMVGQVSSATSQGRGLALRSKEGWFTVTSLEGLPRAEERLPHGRFRSGQINKNRDYAAETAPSRTWLFNEAGHLLKVFCRSDGYAIGLLRDRAGQVTAISMRDKTIQPTLYASMRDALDDRGGGWKKEWVYTLPDRQEALRMIGQIMELDQESQADLAQLLHEKDFK